MSMFYPRKFEDFDVEVQAKDGSWGLVNTASNRVDAEALVKMESERHPDHPVRITHVNH